MADVVANILVTVQHLGLGGMEKIVSELAIALSERGHTITVVGLLGGGAHVSRLQKHGVRVFTGLAQPKRFALWRMAQVCRHQDFAVAASGEGVLPATLTLAACKLMGVPCVRWIHAMPGRSWSRTGTVAQYLMTHAGNRVVALTQVHAEALTASWGVPPDQIRIIPNGQPLPPQKTDAQELAIREELSLGPDAFVVGLVAGFRPIKRHVLLVKAFAQVHRQIPGARLLLVGDGPTSNDVRSTIDAHRLADSVILTGARPDASRLYAAMDIHVMASYPFETFPLALIEAMAAGVAPIATRVGGIATIVEHDRTGILVEPESSVALSKAMLELAQDPEKRQRIADAAAAAAGRFSVDSMVEGFEALIGTTSGQVVDVRCSQ